jgi:hypothetical protein
VVAARGRVKVNGEVFCAAAVLAAVAIACERELSESTPVRTRRRAVGVSASGVELGCVSRAAMVVAGGDVAAACFET